MAAEVESCIEVGFLVDKHEREACEDLKYTSVRLRIYIYLEGDYEEAYEYGSGYSIAENKCQEIPWNPEKCTHLYGNGNATNMNKSNDKHT